MVAAIAGLLMAGCGAAAAPSGPSPAAAPASGQAGKASTAPAQPATSSSGASRPLIHVTLRQTYLVQGYSAPFLLAQEKGFYKAAGFDVSIPQGKGSASTIETVGNGSDQFGFADAGTAVQLISKGEPVKMLSVYLQENPAAFFYQPSKTQLGSLQDLKGKTIITFPQDADYLALPAVLAQAGMTLSDVHPQFVSPADVGAAFARHQQDVLLGFDTFDPIFAKLVPTIRYVPYTKFGFNAYSVGLLTSLNLIRQHPGEVRRFVAATQEGWAYTVQHPAAAVAATLKAYPQQSAAVIAKSLAISLGLLHTPNTQGQPIGWMSPKDWQDTVNVMHRYGGVKDVKPLSDYYTDAFVPQS